MTAIGSLPAAHVGYYLMKASASACQLTYLSRTTPPEICVETLGSFDGAQRSAFQRLTGLPIANRQWGQATFSTKHAGLGLRPASFVADAAYAASSTACDEKASEIWPEYEFAENLAKERACDRMNAYIDGGSSLADGSARSRYTQKQWTALLEKTRARKFKEQAGADERARLNAYGAETSCKWLNMVPSKALDKELTNAVFRDSVALQLGVDVNEEVVPCPFCATLCDLRGRHPLSCMAGGDHDLLHNEVRDEVFSWCQRAGLRPELEKSGLLHGISLPEGRRRPADVLVCRTTHLLQELPGEPAPQEASKVALDFAVVNALGQGHHRETLSAPLTAAIAYGKRKRGHERTQIRCAEAGIAFEPVVVEMQGGVEPRAAAILHRIAEAVAEAEGLDQGSCKRTMLEQLALIVSRRTSKMIRRRVAKASAYGYKGRPLKRVIAEISLEQDGEFA